LRENKYPRELLKNYLGRKTYLGPGMGKKSSSGSGILIWDEHLGSYFRELGNNFLGKKTLKFLNADPEPGSEIF
jgi:hypothetical protein